MSTSRTTAEIYIPFGGMGYSGFDDDVERQLSELATFYWEDYAGVFGSENLGPEDFLDSIMRNFDPQRAHWQIARELLDAINEAALDKLGLELDLSLKTVRAVEDDDDRWVIVASVAPLSEDTDLGDHPVLRYSSLIYRLTRAGCHDDDFLESTVGISEMFYAASCGVDYDGFFADIEKTAREAGFPFERLWPNDGENMH